jgi:hypothetical protein
MIASRVPGLRSVVALLIATAAIAAWRAWPVIEAAFIGVRSDVRPAARLVLYRYYVPLNGSPLWDAIDEADGDEDGEPPHEAPAGPVQTCLPFLAPVLEYPNWQLRISNGVSACSGDVLAGDFTISSTGAVTWSRPGWPVRQLALSSEQLALVRRLDRLSCVRLQPEPTELEWVSIGLDLGKHYEHAGARVSSASTLGRTVTAMLDGLVEQYRRPRRELMGSFDLRLTTTEPGAIYGVRITGGRLTVRRGGKLLIDDPVEIDLLIDLVDAALAQPPVGDPDARGRLLLAGRSVPVSLLFYEKGPFELIHHAVQGARWTEDAQRSRGRRTGTAGPAGPE